MRRCDFQISIVGRPGTTLPEPKSAATAVPTAPIVIRAARKLLHTTCTVLSSSAGTKTPCHPALVKRGFADPARTGFWTWPRLVRDRGPFGRTTAVSHAAPFATPTDVQAELVETIRRFVEREVVPVASRLDHDNEYPHALVERMKELGLFGATIPTEYGGLGLDFSTYAMIIEELCVGWMSLSGILNTHLLLAYMIRTQGTDDQKQRYLPKMAKAELRGALCLTEAHAGSDVQRIRTTATRRGDSYVVNGSKMFVTNGREGGVYALVCKTDPQADPPHKGMSLLIAEKGPGVTISRDIEKIGYKGVDTVEIAFEDFHVPAANLLGGVEGHGMQHVL